MIDLRISASSLDLLATILMPDKTATVAIMLENDTERNQPKSSTISHHTHKNIKGLVTDRRAATRFFDS